MYIFLYTGVTTKVERSHTKISLWVATILTANFLRHSRKRQTKIMDVISSFMLPTREPLLRSSTPVSAFGLFQAAPTAAPPTQRRLEISRDDGDDDDGTEVTFSPGGSWWFDPSSVTLSQANHRAASPPSAANHERRTPRSVQFRGDGAIREQLSPPRLVAQFSAPTTKRESNTIANLLAARSPYRLSAPLSASSAPPAPPQLRMPNAPAAAVTDSTFFALDDHHERNNDASTILVRWACASCPLNDVLRLPRSHHEIRFCPQCGNKQPSGEGARAVEETQSVR